MWCRMKDDLSPIPIEMRKVISDMEKALDKAFDEIFDEYVHEVKTEHGTIRFISDSNMPSNQMKVLPCR